MPVASRVSLVPFACQRRRPGPEALQLHGDRRRRRDAEPAVGKDRSVLLGWPRGSAGRATEELPDPLRELGPVWIPGLAPADCRRGRCAGPRHALHCRQGREPGPDLLLARTGNRRGHVPPDRRLLQLVLGPPGIKEIEARWKMVKGDAPTHLIL